MIFSYRFTSPYLSTRKPIPLKPRIELEIKPCQEHLQIPSLILMRESTAEKIAIETSMIEISTP